MAKQLKKWQGWLLFGGSMLIVFVLGLICSSLLERRAEVASVFNNRRTPMTDSIVSQNEKFKEDFPREYETWAMTEDTTFKSMYNGSQERDILESFPDIVIIWAGYAFSKNYSPEGTVMPLKTCARFCARATPASAVMATYSRAPAGPARDRTFPG